MHAVLARFRSLRQEVLFELQRFAVLWRYRHQVPPFALWWRLVLKRIVDLMGGLAILALCSPIMAVIAVLVRLDSPGPILFTQERMGRLGRTFRIFKFRTMVQDAEAATGPVWARPENDPRLTPLGGFLRRTHLDELPQLFNVIMGEMSLVGPRPERPCFVEQLVQSIPAYDHRLFVKPGMTGLAQVHYQYDQSIEDVKRKLRFDLLYVKRMCLMLDVRILAWTFLVVVTGRGIR
jgi:lipopolysaccharide/colanic/teichoic acid biosynthesis glycosyltransferase